MPNRDWYRSETWTSEIEAEFEKRLKRSRTRFNQAQYLKIQGLTLIGSKNAVFQTKGIDLLKRVISQYSDQNTEVAHTHEVLANYFTKTRNFVAAEAEYREVLAYYSRTPSRTCTSGLADLSFVELILESNASAKYKEAENLLDLLAQIARQHILFNSDVLRYHAASARLLARVGRLKEAATHAGFALKAVQIKEPQFSRHPKVGIPHPSEDLIEELQGIAEWRSTVPIQ